MTIPAQADALPPRWRMWPLYAAGFTTAFGAHGIAANLGSQTADVGGSLLYLGVLLALYDGAELVLKPVFGSIADRVGARPVLIGGLIAFAAASAVFVVIDDPSWLWLARLGQGAGASAFSPAASALVARMHPKSKQGKAFGSYGFYKSIGYTLGPLLGGAIVWVGGAVATVRGHDGPGPRRRGVGGMRGLLDSSAPAHPPNSRGLGQASVRRGVLAPDGRTGRLDGRPVGGCGIFARLRRR